MIHESCPLLPRKMLISHPASPSFIWCWVTNCLSVCPSVCLSVRQELSYPLLIVAALLETNVIFPPRALLDRYTSSCTGRDERGDRFGRLKGLAMTKVQLCHFRKKTGQHAAKLLGATGMSHVNCIGNLLL